MFENNLKSYTVTEISEAFGMSKTKILSLLKSGELKGFRLTENGTWRIPHSCLEEFVKKKTPKF